MACDFLWSYRNRAYHDGLSFDALQMSRQINKVPLEHTMAWQQPSHAPVEEKWVPPPPSFLKINFDTAIRDTFSVQAAVCRDHNGHIIKMDTQINQPCQPNMGEALAAQLATTMALSLSIKSFILEGDFLPSTIPLT